MAKFDKIQVLQKMGETGMVPVFYHKDADIACAVVKACYDGGVRAFEFTNRGDFAHEVFEKAVKFAAKECPEMAVGVGSVVDPATAALYIQLGACFVVGPLLIPRFRAYATAGSFLTLQVAALYLKSGSLRRQDATCARYSPATFSALSL